MNYAVYNIALDIHKTGSQVALSMIRGENKRKIVISLMENGRPYKIADGCKAVFTATKPDGKFIYNDCEIDIKNNQIIYYVTSQTTAAMGEVKCQLKLIGVDGGLLFSPTFSLIIANTLYSEQPILASSEEFNALTKYLADVQQKFTSPPYVIICEGAGENITLDDSADAIFKGFKIYGKSTQNGTPTPEAPIDIVSVGDDGNVCVNINGANLVKTKTIIEQNAKYSSILFVEANLKPNMQYTISFKGSVGNKYYLNEFLFSYKSVTVQEGVTTVTVTTTNNFDNLSDIYVSGKGWIIFKNDMEQTKPNVFDELMLNIGSVSLPYQPYSEQIVAFSPALKAVPVTDSSLATYTDSSGRMWCADEIDLERGVHVQRVKKKKVESALNWNYSESTYRFISLDVDFNKKSALNAAEVLCSHFKANQNNVLDDLEVTFVNDTTNGFAYRYDALNGDVEAWKTFLKENEVYIIGILATPIETPLSPEIISQYKELHTNLPNTTILNDENAFMEIEYIADPKSYIKKNSGSIAKVSTVTLAASKWVGSKSPYSQVVNISGIPADYTGTVRLTPEQAEAFRGKDVAFMVGNKNGIITVYCIGQKLTGTYDVEIKFEKEERI